MRFAVNYVNNEFNSKYKFDKDIYLKYPGFSASIDELTHMPKLNNKILLHGIVPSSGSIFDEHLCDNMDKWADIFKKSNNRWVSLHFYYKDSFCPINKVEEVCYNNITKIKKFLPDIPIIIENVPYAYKEFDFCLDPNIISYYCNKYDLGFLLDISHMCIYAGNNNLNVDEYLKKLPIDKLYEVHISGYYIDEKGKFYDAHFECFDRIYNLYERILYISNKVKMTSLEYPVYNNIPVVIKYLENKNYDEIYTMQNKQLNKIREIYNNYLYKNINRTKGVLQ